VFKSCSRYERVSAFFYVMLSHVGRSLAMGQSPFQGVLPKHLETGFIVS